MKTAFQFTNGRKNHQMHIALYSITPIMGKLAELKYLKPCLYLLTSKSTS